MHATHIEVVAHAKDHERQADVDGIARHDGIDDLAGCLDLGRIRMNTKGLASDQQAVGPEQWHALACAHAQRDLIVIVRIVEAV